MSVVKTRSSEFNDVISDDVISVVFVPELLVCLQQVTQGVVVLFLLHQRATFLMQTHGQDQRLGTNTHTHIRTIISKHKSKDVYSLVVINLVNYKLSSPSSHWLGSSVGSLSGLRSPGMVCCQDLRCHLKQDKYNY